MENRPDTTPEITEKLMDFLVENNYIEDALYDPRSLADHLERKGFKIICKADGYKENL